MPTYVSTCTSSYLPSPKTLVAVTSRFHRPCAFCYSHATFRSNRVALQSPRRDFPARGGKQTTFSSNLDSESQLRMSCSIIVSNYILILDLSPRVVPRNKFSTHVSFYFLSFFNQTPVGLGLIQRSEKYPKDFQDARNYAGIHSRIKFKDSFYE